MATMKCPECGRDVWTGADKCPKCGYRFTPAKRKKQANAGGASDVGLPLILGVVGCGLVLSGVVGGAVILAVLAFRTGAEKEWVAFTDPDSGTSVLMPGVPFVKEQMIPGTNQPMKMHVVDLRNKAYFFSSVVLPPERLRMPRDQFFADVRQGALQKEPNSKLESDKAILHETHQGREVVFSSTNPRGGHVMRLFVVKNRMYVLAVGGDSVAPEDTDVKKFFASFKLENPPQLPPDLEPKRAELKPRQAELEPRQAGNGMIRIYLSDLQEIEPNVGFGRFGKNGVLGYLNDAPIEVAERVYSKGLSAHPPNNGASSVTYRLARKARMFHTLIGIVPHASEPKREPPDTPLQWQVLGDGKILWISAPLQRYGVTQECRVNVENVAMLELQVHCPGSFQRARAAWLNPYVLMPTEEAVKSLEHPPNISYFSDGTTMRVLRGLQPEKLTGDLIWTPTADAVYALTKDGVVSRVSLKTGDVEKQTTLSSSCSSLALSADFLLVAKKEAHEVWLLDPVSLDVKRKVSTPRIQRLLSGPKLKFALFTADAPFHHHVAYLDLAEGKILSQTPAPLLHGRMSPDGKYYFAQNGTEQLCRFRIEGTKLIEEEVSERIATIGHNIFVSADSKLVCIPARDGNGPRLTTHVYDVVDIRHPLVGLQTERWGPNVVEFDPAHKLFLANTQHYYLAIWNMNGVKLRQYMPIDHNDNLRQLLVHPRGGKVLVVTEKKLAFVEFNDDVANWRLVGQKKPFEFKPPVAEKTPVELLDLKVTRAQGIHADKLVTEPIWTTTGDAFFALTGDGCLSLVSGRDFRLQKQTELGPNCYGMALSAEGLLVVKLNPQEAWVVDPIDLQVKKKIPIKEITRVLSGPQLSFALVITRYTGGDLDPIGYLDVVKGKLTDQALTTARAARITPDGKYYFAGSRQKLHRFRLEETKLVAVDSSQPIAGDFQNIFVSADSKLVCLLPRNLYDKAGAAIYSVDNLEKPLLTLPAGGYSNVVAFDPAAKLVYSRNQLFGLIAYGMNGSRQDYLFRLPEGRHAFIVANPQGRKILTTTGNQLILVELPPEAGSS